MSESEFGRGMKMPDEASAEQVEAGQLKHYKVKLFSHGKFVRDCGVHAANPEDAVIEAKKQLETPNERIAELLAQSRQNMEQEQNQSGSDRAARRDRNRRAAPEFVMQSYDVQVMEMQYNTVGNDEDSEGRQMKTESHVLNKTWVEIGTWR